MGAGLAAHGGVGIVGSVLVGVGDLVGGAVGGGIHGAGTGDVLLLLWGVEVGVGWVGWEAEGGEVRG